jgi:hypothetical protein
MVLIQPDQVGGFMGRGSREQFIEEEDWAWGGNAGSGAALIASGTVFGKGWRANTANSGTLMYVTTGQSPTVTGVLQMETVTNAASLAAFARFPSGAPTRIFGAGQKWTLRWKMNIATLGDATQRFEDFHGFINSIAAAPTDGLCFNYRDNLSSGNWRFTAIKATVITVAAGPAVPVVAGTFAEGEIRWNGMTLPWRGVPAMTARGLINGVSLGDIALADLPANPVAEGSIKLRTVGVAQRLTFLDYSDVDLRWDPPRAA